MPTVKDITVTKPDQAQDRDCRTWPIWTCDTSRFDWDYTQTETCLILEGQVTITDRPETGESVSFGPGDLVVFPVELRCVWDITKPVKKHYSFS